MSYHLWRDCVCGQRWVMVSAGFCTHSQTKKKKKRKNGCKSTFQISSKRMIDPPPAQTSIYCTINCGQCWRNAPAPGGPKILTHWMLWFWRQWEKFFWQWFVNRSMTGLNVCSVVCQQKVVILSNDHWKDFLKYFLSFLKMLYQYLLFFRVNKSLEYWQNIWLY